MEILNRNSNTINIATFWENHQLKKYDYSPPYQRPDNVWSESKKSFLIDSILKNFPIPPIFLHQHIDDQTGKTVYDVIDGKQRLTAIIDYIENNISLPEDFTEDETTIELNGSSFKDLDKSEFRNWKSNFWKYELSIEYVDTDQREVVKNIFDRLNRNGEPLTAQELRNARYNSSNLYSKIKELSLLDFWTPLLSKLERNRLEHEEFISELFFVVLTKQIFASDSSTLDSFYEEYTKENIDNQKFESAKTEFINITRIIESFNLDYEKFKIYGVSHLYGIFCLGWILNSTSSKIDKISEKLNFFYELLRNKSDNQNTKEYQISMNAGTKSKGRRLRRINSLLKYLSLETIS